ncbi:helix-turn-helix domain-containing protein [Sulfoacidibacillus thermotolerans]|uniref:HTH cro/C1-type domain-containing protein n=1 Tax=Sulfoacidibacillus thermotolerans TaxID=1765684 RepID=A0A2U3D7I6_SULT2|nr:helix-turn-helix transcriptional regulator [Sulfoacidibacillus thermotolerans]PWI57238.1 hypothetical protein BM613_09635 [Sulfoacidibacillus thermotolerans]
MNRVTRFSGAKIRELRKAHGWSLEELSRRSGLSISHLSALEKGNRKSPSVDLVYDLSEAFHVSMYYFMDRESTSDVPSSRFSYPSETSPGSSESTSHSPLPSDEQIFHWTRTLRPETLAFMLHEDAEAYLTFAHNLYANRHSTAQLVQLMNEFIQKANEPAPSQDGFPIDANHSTD